MSKFTLPDPHDTRDIIADYLALRQVGSRARQEQIIKNCLIPITLLFKAGEMACTAGSDEEAVFAYFLAMLHAQAAHPAPCRKRGPDRHQPDLVEDGFLMPVRK